MEARETTEQPPVRLTSVHVDIRFEGDEGMESIGLAFIPTHVIPIVRVSRQTIEDERWATIGYDDGEFAINRREARLIGERLICFANHGTLVEPIPAGTPVFATGPEPLPVDGQVQA